METDPRNDLAPLRDAAIAWATELLRARWPADRFRLELVAERSRRSPLLAGAHYEARLRVWEAAGVVRVEVRDSGAIASPANGEDVADAAALPPGDLRARVESVALDLARRERGGLLAVRSCVRLPGRGPPTCLVVPERAAPDGQVRIDLEGASGARIGFLCVPWLRGSRRSAALGRRAAVARGRAALDLPDGARLSATRLVDGRLGRAWRLRWEAEGPAGSGVVVATLNARTGVLCGVTSTVRPPPAEPSPAERLLAAAVRGRLGSGARSGPLVPAALPGPGGEAAAWLAVVHGADGRRYRATVAAGQVELVACAPPPRRSARGLP